MTLGRTLRRLRAALWRLPVLVALAVIGLLPPGVMPRQGADGQLTMVICSGDGPVRMVLDPATGEMKRETPNPDRPGCAWAMAQSLPDLVQPVTLTAPLRAARPVTPATTAVLWRPAHDPRGLYARGPPTLI